MSWSRSTSSSSSPTSLNLPRVSRARMMVGQTRWCDLGPGWPAKRAVTRTSWHNRTSLSLPLHAFRGRPVVLTFFPAAFEPVSREQLTLYQEYLPQIEALDAQTLGISVDHTWCHEAFAREAGIHFPRLADYSPAGAVCRLYGVYREREETAGRALFVIDQQGIIRFSQSYPDLINPGVDDVLTTLEGLNGARS